MPKTFIVFFLKENQLQKMFFWILFIKNPGESKQWKSSSIKKGKKKT